MAKKVLIDTYYTFTPETNTIVIPRVIQRENLMLITNVTTNQVIYNFSDPDLNAISYSVKGSSVGSTTTIVLNYFCGEMLSTDKLQVLYDEYDEKITPSDLLVDAVGKMRVAAPQSLIDTDFEYGTQGNKWEALTLLHNYASFFSKGTGGNSFDILDIVAFASSTNARVKSSVGVVTLTAHGLATNDVVSVQETTNNNAEGTFPIIVPSSMTFTVNSTTDILTYSSGHNLFQGQPIIFSSIGGATGTSNGVSFAANIVYYVDVLSATTIKLYNAPPSTSRFLVDFTANGTGLVTDVSKMFTYKGKARIPSSSILDGTATSIVGGGIYDNAHIPGGVDGSYDTWSVGIDAGGLSNIPIITTEPHGLIPGTPILINGVTTINSSLGGGITGTDVSSNLNGAWLVEAITSPTAFTLKRTILAPNPFAGGDVNANALLVCKPDSYIQHTSQNGGVQLSTVNNVVGVQQIRQTRKTFRYQSGKAIQFSTGAKFTPSYDIESIKSDVQTGTATVIVTTVQDHGLQYGSRVKIEGIEVIGGDINPYNGDFLVKNVINQNTFTFSTTITPAFIYATNMNPSGENSSVTVSTWAGAVTRAGLFNEMNGIFFEYDGEKLWACKRSSNKPLYGTINVTNKSNYVTGTDTRFTKQLIVGDSIVIKGQVYKVLSIDSDKQLRVAPAYRGINLIESKFYKVQTIRVSQDDFNLDRLDGTGPSGYILDPTKMQMVYIDYTWYGSGFVRFGMRMINGDIQYCHRMPNNNINTQSYMRSGNLPARYEVNHSAPRTKLISGTDSSTDIPSSSDLPGKTLDSTDKVMYVQDISGWRKVSPSKSNAEIIGYLLVEKNGASPISEIMGYTSVGSYNTTVGGYPISIVRNQKQPLVIGNYEGLGTISTNTGNTIINGVGTSFTSLNAGDFLYLSNGVKIGEVLSITNDTNLFLKSAPPVSPIVGPDQLPQGYTAEKYSVVQVSSLYTGLVSQTFYPDSSVPGSLYQSLNNVAVSNAATSVFTLPVGTFLDTRVVAGTRVDIIDANNSSLNQATTYYIQDPQQGAGTFKLNTNYSDAASNIDQTINYANATGVTVSLNIANTEQVSVRVITQNCAPSLSHWGSSVIMDGGYDEDRGVSFNTRMKRSLTIPSNVSRPLVSIRIAPSVDNGIGKNFGKREVINTMQLVLQQIETLGNGPFLIEGIFNPNTLTDSTMTGLQAYPLCWETFRIGSGSLAQVLFHDGTGTGTGTVASPTGTYSGGDTIFSFYTDNSGGTNLSTTRYDLSSIKELGTSILSGNGSTKTPGFPNGPDILTIVATNIGSTTGIINARLSWSEAQT